MHPKNICAPLLLNISVEHFQIVIKAAALTQMLLTTAFAIHFRETNITSLPHMILGRIYLVLMRQTIQSYGRTRGKKFCLRPLNPAMMQKKAVQWQELLPWFKLKVADREEKSNHWCSTWIETIPRYSECLDTPRRAPPPPPKPLERSYEEVLPLPPWAASTWPQK